MLLPSAHIHFVVLQLYIVFFCFMPHDAKNAKAGLHLYTGVVSTHCLQVKLTTMAQPLRAPCNTIFDAATASLLGSAECTVVSEVRFSIVHHLESPTSNGCPL